MPTASPSMIARVGALLEMPTTEDSPISAVIVPTTPTSAVSSGKPAETIEPKVMSKMASATRTPISSVGPTVVPGGTKASPP